MSSISADIGTNTGRVFALNNLDARFNLDAEL
jgi:hypothetical protein